MMRLRPLHALATVATVLILAATCRAQFGDIGGGPGGASGWKVAIDPPAVPLTVSIKDLSIPIPQGFGHGPRRSTLRA